jgi:general secretion pathway protein K
MKNSKKAVVLVITLWVLVLLSLIGLAFVRTVRVDARISRYHKNNLQALLLAKSGLTVLAADILADNNEFDSLSEDWLRKYLYTKEEMDKKGHGSSLREFEVKDKDGKLLGTYSVRITDEMGKFNINAIDEAMDNMVKYLFDSVQSDNKEGIVDSILDWIDPDDLHRLNGAEEEYYKELSSPYHCKNGPLDTLEEMLLIRGITPQIFYGTDKSKGIASLVRIYPSKEESVRINVNTAPIEVLEALLKEFGESLPQSILEQRSGRDGIEPSEDDEPFKNTQDILKLPSVAEVLTGLKKEEDKKGWTDRLMKRIDVKSSIFRVESTGRLKNYNAKRKITTILRKDPSGLKTLYWREG